MIQINHECWLNYAHVGSSTSLEGGLLHNTGGFWLSWLGSSWWSPKWFQEVRRVQFCVLRSDDFKSGNNHFGFWQNKKDKDQCPPQHSTSQNVDAAGLHESLCQCVIECWVHLHILPCLCSLCFYFLSLFLPFFIWSAMCWYGVLDWSAEQLLCWEYIFFLTCYFTVGGLYRGDLHWVCGHSMGWIWAFS